MLYTRPVLADRDPAVSWLGSGGFNFGYKPASQIIPNWSPRP
jgi:hypothetical protein